MTAHTTPIHDNTQAAAAGRTAAIIPFHVATAPGSAEPDLAALALARLETFLAEEGPGLSQVLRPLRYRHHGGGALREYNPIPVSSAEAA
jgi:hypothetical protein